MGYTTEFSGSFKLNRAIEPAHREYLVAFNETRRMGRDCAHAEALPDPKREAAGLPIGMDGGYFVGGGGFAGQKRDGSIIDYNKPPAKQPGLWCQWVPNADGTEIVWDGGEKFYHYVEWLQYVVDHFLKPWGYLINGVVEWSGEEQGDVGRILAKDNVIATSKARLAWEGEAP